MGSEKKGTGSVVPEVESIFVQLLSKSVYLWINSIPSRNSTSDSDKTTFAPGNASLSEGQIKEVFMSFRKAKILVTMGPSIRDPEILRKVFEAGADAVRLNFSHGSHEEHASNIRIIRKVAKEMKRPCAILADLMGPKVRVDDQAYTLEVGGKVSLVPDKGNPAKNEIGISHKRLYHLVKKGQRILLDDGQLELVVNDVQKKHILCEVIVGGLLKSKKSLNVPGVDIELPILGEKDKADLQFIKSWGLDWVAASFVRNAKDVADVKSYMKELGIDIPVISKIENAEALNFLREIVEASEGVMVARGDLGVEVELELIPTVQRNVIHLARELGKVTIIATQMLETMTNSPRPTRAEVTDVSNAALARVDALMLSGETAAGKYPVQTVKMMDKIIRTTEQNLEEEIVSIDHPEITSQTCEAGIYFGLISGAKALVTISTFGRTPRIFSTYRGNIPVVVACTREEILHRSTLYYSVRPITIRPKKDPEEIFDRIATHLKAEKLVKKGDFVIFVFGFPIHALNRTNSIRQWQIE